MPAKRSSGRWKTWSAVTGSLSAAALFLALAPHAHATGDAHLHTLVPPEILLALTGVLGLVTAWRPRGWRRVVAFGLIALLTVLAVETALHSVHHLGDAEAEASCDFTCAGSHLSGVTSPTADLGAPTATFERADDRGPSWPVPFEPIRPREGRAPPVPVPA